jgi:hypothetical protein
LGLGFSSAEGSLRDPTLPFRFGRESTTAGSSKAEEPEASPERTRSVAGRVLSCRSAESAAAIHRRLLQSLATGDPGGGGRHTVDDASKPHAHRARAAGEFSKNPARRPGSKNSKLAQASAMIYVRSDRRSRPAGSLPSPPSKTSARARISDLTVCPAGGRRGSRPPLGVFGLGVGLLDQLEEPSAAGEPEARAGPR